MVRPATSLQTTVALQPHCPIDPGVRQWWNWCCGFELVPDADAAAAAISNLQQPTLDRLGRQTFESHF